LRKKEVIIEDLKKAVLKDIKMALKSDCYLHYEDLGSSVKMLVINSVDFIFETFGEVGFPTVDLSEEEMDFLVGNFKKNIDENNFISKKDIEDYLKMEIDDYMKLRELEKEYKDKYKTKN